MGNRVIALMDADAFFAACERTVDPRLAGRAVVVVADAKRRSVVLAASYEARPHGVRTGMVLHEARKLCPQLAVVESHPPLYLHLSAEIEKILRDFSDRVEMASVDEAYLDLTGVLDYFRLSALDLCRMAQLRIQRELGLPVTFGVGPNKLLAKLLADLAKPEGIREIRTVPDASGDPSPVEALLETMPVEKLCGIGSRLREALAEMGVRTAGELGRAPLQALTARFGVIGWTLKRMGQGLDDRPVLACASGPEEVKSVGHAHTLAADTSNPLVVRSFLFFLSEKVAARLRRYGLAGRVAHVTIRTAGFETFGRQRKMSVPASSGPQIYGVARGLLDELWPCPRTPLRLIGVSVSDLSARSAQPPLLAAERRRLELDDVVDQINARFGRWTIRPAAQIPAERFGILTPPVPPKLGPLHRTL
ncbi:MAG: hypothetical protein A3G34_06365 [Candidatus Lindowbacteria bacterium RIFCSPLOWO2_12_FULL_62_27]|nr:MAG: hypothetical protein A3G34_06365 [Candidatus Lindowbacteria bacterium RIFCSPLOWO2_12_FULL_62_27]